MQRYLVVAVVSVLVLLICYVSGVALAQEEQETKYSWGTVSSVSPSQIVVKEYNYDVEEEVDITYTPAPDIEFENVDSLKSIAVGDSVDIEYVVKGDKRVATLITVEKPSYDEDMPPEASWE